MPLARERPSYHPQANPAHPYATDKVDWEGVLVAVKLFAIAGILIGLVGLGHGHSFASLWPLWAVGGLAVVAIFYTLLPGYPYSAPRTFRTRREEAYASACYAAGKRLEEPVYRWAEKEKVGGDDLSRARLVEMVLQHAGEERTDALKAKLTSLVVRDRLEAEDPDAPPELGKHLLKSSCWCSDAIWKGRHRALTRLGTLIRTCGLYLEERRHDQTTKPSEVIEALLLEHDGPINVGVGGALGLIADGAALDAAVAGHAAYIFPAQAASPAQVASEVVKAAAEVIGESEARALRGVTVTEWLRGREEAKVRRKQSAEHAVALADWTGRLAPTFGAEYELDLKARGALLAQPTDAQIGDLVDGLDLSRAEEREILTRYFVCEALAEKLGLSQGLKRVLSTDAFMRKVGDLSWAPRRNLPQKLAVALPHPLPWGVEMGSQANVGVCEANQKLLRILEFAIRYVRELDEHDSEPIAAVAAIAGHREYADRRYGDPTEPAAVRMWEMDAAWWAERASEVRIADTMEEIVNERAADFRVQAEQTTLRAQLVSLCAAEQAAAELRQEARLPVAAAEDSHATVPVASNGHSTIDRGSANPGRRVKPAKPKVGRPGLALGLQATAHTAALADWTKRLAPAFAGEHEAKLAARAAKLIHRVDRKIGGLADALADGREKELAALTRYLVCRDLAARLGFPQGQRRLLYANALLGEDPAGLPAFRREDLPRKLRKLLPKPIPLEKSEPGTELAFKLSIQSQRLFRVVILASAFCEALKQEDSDSEAAAAVCRAQRAHAEGYDERLRSTSADESTQRERLKAHQAFECELAETMEKVVAERSASFLEEAKQTTLRAQLVALCAEEEVAAELYEELRLPAAIERESKAKVPVASNGDHSAQPAKDAKPERAGTKVGRPGLALGLGLAAFAALVPAFLLLAPASTWQPLGLVAGLVGLLMLTHLKWMVFTHPTHAVDAGFAATLLALVFLGPIPAAALWIGSEVFQWLWERYRVNAFLANISSQGWAILVAAMLLGIAKGGVPLALPTTRAYVWLGVSGIVLLTVNYFVMSFLLTVVRDGKNWWPAIHAQFIMTLPAQLTMTALAVGAVFLYAYVGLIALAVFAVIVPIPQLLMPTIIDRPQVAHALNTSATGRSALGLARLLGYLPAPHRKAEQPS